MGRLKLFPRVKWVKYGGKSKYEGNSIGIISIL